jgi:phage replication O-like protein O
VTRSPGPQLEQGHTRIANELLVALARHLTGSGNQLAVMLLVMRYSYGYQRKLATFTIREIAAKLELDRKNVRVAIQALEARNMLLVTEWEGHKRKKYQIQKDLKRWV